MAGVNIWLTGSRMERLQLAFPKSRGKPWLGDWRVLRGTIYPKKNRLRWKGTHRIWAAENTLHQLRAMVSRGFVRPVLGQALPSGTGENVIINSTHLKAHRTVAGLLNGGARPGVIRRA